MVTHSIFLSVFLNLCFSSDGFGDFNASNIEQEFSFSSADIIDLANLGARMKPSMKRPTSSECMLSRTCFPL